MKYCIYREVRGHEACGGIAPISAPVTIQVHHVSEEVDPAVVHLCTDNDGLGWIGMEVGETSTSPNPVGNGVEVASVA